MKKVIVVLVLVVIVMIAIPFGVARVGLTSQTFLPWIGTIAAEVVAAVALVAVFQDRIRGELASPRLDLALYAHPPDCHKIPIVNAQHNFRADCYYLRLRVINKGNQRAELVEVFAEDLTKRDAKSEFVRVPTFVPLNLAWSHTHEMFFPSIAPYGTYKHCDLAHVIDPKERIKFPYENTTWPGVPADRAILSFDTFIKSFVQGHLQPFGVYRLHLLVAAANAKPIRRTLEITLSGDWYSSEDQMLRDGIGLKFV